MRTTSTVALARPAREQMPFDLLNADADAQHVYKSASERVLGALTQMRLRWQWVRRRRTDNAVRALVDVAEDVTMLWNAGATEAELRLFANYVNGVIDRLSTGCAQRSLPTLDQEETQLEGAENSLQTERLVMEAQGRTVPADLLLREADATEGEANVSLEKSRTLRRRARSVPLTRHRTT